MSDKKDFFDMSSKQGMAMGLLAGIALVSVIVLFGGGTIPGLGKVAGSSTTVTGNNAPAAPAAAPAAPAAPAPSAVTATPPPVTGEDHIRGNANAKITMIEYSDFECPFCSRHKPTLDQVLSQYGDDVRLIYRHFPLTSIHPNAQKSAEASECAGEQGKFWEFHDLLFANQQALTVPSLKQYAGQLNLNQSQFDSCLDSGKFTAKVNKQASDAQAVGITGTPGTFVENQLVRGAFPLATFTQIIDGLL